MSTSISLSVLFFLQQVASFIVNHFLSIVYGIPYLLRSLPMS